MATQRVTDVNGWFEVKRNPLSRVGVFPYRGASVGLEGADAERTIRVYRPEEELSSPECIESFKLLPWVDEHTLLGPDDGQTPAEVKGVQGVIGEEVVYDSGVLYGNIKAFSNSLGRLIEAGKRQLSAGYRCVYDWTAGTYNGQPYDCVQRRIRGNHLALVNEGRMGPSVAVMDSLTFTFDAQEAIAMADAEKTGGAESMTLADAIKMLGEIAPQVASLTAAVAKLGTPPATTAAATPDAAAATTPATPPAAAAATGAEPTADKAVAAAMDAALKPIRDQIEGIGKTLTALDSAFKGMPTAILADSAARDKLADRLAAHIGTFDAKDKTLAQVASYGCEKVGLKPVAGAELVAVEAWLHGRAPTTEATVRTGLDAAPGGATFVSKFLTGEAAK